MKKIYFALVMGLILMGGFSYNLSAARPEKVAKTFLSHLADNKLEKAIQLATPETAEMLKLWQQEGFNRYRGLEIEFEGCELISDSVAVCRYGFDIIGEQLYTVKIDGKWKAQMEK